LDGSAPASGREASAWVDRLNSAQADSVIHAEVAAAVGMTPSAKEMALVMFDNILAKTIQGPTVFRVKSAWDHNSWRKPLRKRSSWPRKRHQRLIE
jgi:hypothetical protein